MKNSAQNETPMQVCRHSWTVIAVAVMTTWAMGCRGTSPSGQMIKLTEDPAVSVPSTDPPPQRLSSAQAATKPAASESPKNRSTALLDREQQIKTRLAAARNVVEKAKQTSVDPVAKLAATASYADAPMTKTSAAATQAASVAERKPAPDKPSAVAKELESPASSTLAAKPTSRRTISRSDAVEALLAANRGEQPKRSRSTEPRRTSAPASQTKSAVSDNRVASTHREAKPSSVSKTQVPPASDAKRKAENPTAKSELMAAFDKLPAGVKQRALDRLVENLSKTAESTSQPNSMTQSLAASMDQLPTLPALKNKAPDILPSRIAHAGKPSPRKQVAPKSDPTSGLQEIPVTNLAAGTAVRSVEDIPVRAAPQAVHVATAVARTPASKESVKSQPVAKPATTSVATSSAASMAVAESDAPAASRQAIAKTSQLAHSATATQPSKDSATDQPASSAVTMPESLHAPTPPAIAIAPPAQPATSAVPGPPFLMPENLTPPVQVQTVAKAKPRRPVDLKSIDLSMPSLSSEVTRLPHQLQRDEFRVSQIGLPNPLTFDLPKSKSPVQNIPVVAPPGAVRVASASETATTEQKRSETLLSPAGTPIDATTTNSEPSVLVLPAVQDRDTAASNFATVSPDSIAESVDPNQLTDDELFRALLNRLGDPNLAQSDTERSRRLIMARHLMVLSGDPEAAMKHIDGLSKQEQSYLSNQLQSLWTIIDPKGHPVAGRRFTTALPKLREATRYLAAASDSLEVHGLAFCTEIESYGQIKTFPGNRFTAGQQVILYCEVDNFIATQNADGYHTHLQGSFDVYNQDNEKVVSQLLPTDKQVSRKVLRDYFIAYQMHLPKQLKPGTYRLQLTIEDVESQKYGQASIPVEITE